MDIAGTATRWGCRGIFGEIGTTLIIVILQLLLVIASIGSIGVNDSIINCAIYGGNMNIV
jgi:hypothetical protein